MAPSCSLITLSSATSSVIAAETAKRLIRRWHSVCCIPEEWDGCVLHTVVVTIVQLNSL